MNATNIKFKKLLEKEIAKRMKSLQSEHKKFIREAVVETIKSEKLYNVDTDKEAAILGIDIRSKTEKEFRNLKGEEINEVAELKFLLEVYTNKPFFTNFDLLQKYFKIFDLLPKEQAEVLAYFINVDMELVIEFVPEQNLDSKNFLILRDIIDENGEIKPVDLSKLKSYKNAIENSFLPLNNELIYLLLGESQYRTLVELKKAEDAKNLTQLKQKNAEARKLKLEESIKKGKLTIKDKKEALEKLNSYLYQNMPIRYIDVFEIKEVVALLKKAEYPELQIMQIKMRTKENNEKLLTERYENYFNLAKMKYLSTEEIEILAKAEEILRDENPINNEILSNIKVIYSYIKNQLFTFYELNADNYPEYNEAAELILLYIEELRNTIISYNASDYRRVLVTTENK